MDEYDGGAPNYKRYAQEHREHPIEVTGGQLRPMMSWISESE
jgi:ketol-acid reductoisomerase